MSDTVIEDVHPLQQGGQCVDGGAEKRKNNRFTCREVSTELGACGNGNYIAEA